jgi:hypothetical protein
MDGKKYFGQNFEFDKLEKNGWHVIDYYPDWVTAGITGWIRENMDLPNDVLWNGSILYFRKEIDAVAFKLRWI